MRTFLVTGASRGIGLGLVQHLLRQPDTKVIATCRSPDTTQAFDDLLQQYQERILVMMLDVTSEFAFEVLKGQLAEKGVTSIDVLIANAGITGERDNFHECQRENFNEVFETNVLGTMLTFQNLSPLVVKSTAKIFINISSILGSITEIGNGYGANMSKMCISYRMSKSCANMMSMTLSRDPEIQAAGCKVLCIHPGWVQTDMGGAGGQTATFTVDECATNIMDILNRTVAMQDTMVSTTSDTGTVFKFPPRESSDESSDMREGGRKEFEQALQAGNNCVFVSFDGSILPW